MTVSTDAYWDELGVAWRAANIDAKVIAPRLKSRLQRQSVLIYAGGLAGLPLGIAGILLGAFTLWNGWTTGAWNFVTRGVAIVAISALIIIAVAGLLRVRSADYTRTLAEMIDLATARAEKTLLTVRLALCACAIATVFGLAGTAIRTYFAKPPALSPIVDLVVTAIVALGLFLYGRHTSTTLAKFRYLKEALGLSSIGSLNDSSGR